jgi:hypothetical protein
MQIDEFRWRCRTSSRREIPFRRCRLNEQGNKHKMHLISLRLRDASEGKSY